MKTVSSLLLLILLAANETAHATQAEIKPITEDALIRLLDARISAVRLIRTLETRGVGFQLTSLFEQELTNAGKYLGEGGLNGLLAAVRANFRPPPVRPYRLTYRLLKGHALDLLLEGHIGRWDKELDGKYFIVQNEVFKTLSQLVTRFSDPFGGERFLREGGPPRTTSRLPVLFESQDKELFAGSNGALVWTGGIGRMVQVGSLDSDSQPGSSSVKSLVHSLGDPDEQWRFYVFKENLPNYLPKKPQDIITFRRFSKPGDFDLYDTESSLQQFYSYITKHYMPPDFGITELSLRELIDGCAHHARATSQQQLGWTVSFFGPLMRVNIAIIENISNEPITVGRFILKETHSDQLLSREAARAALNLQPSQKQELFGPRILKPGESLVVPIELSLKTEKKDLEVYLKSLYTREITPAYADTSSRPGGFSGVAFDDNGVKTLSVNAESLQRIIRRQPIDFLSMSEYVYGPSVSIESLEINKFGYLVRSFDPRKLFITSEYGEGGSCPYVSTYSAKEKAWTVEGVILYGRNSKLKESTDQIGLHRFDGRVLIQEKDPEESFIDSLYIRAVSRAGKETIIYPREAKLRTADGEYLRLRQGDRFMVSFQVPDELLAQKYFLVASGYYVPYRSKSANLIRRSLGIRLRRFSSGL